MMRIAIISLCGLIIASTYASPTNPPKVPEDFNNYVEGALVVYSQFKTPSKQESEEFYKFIKSKWTYTQCTDNCGKLGYKAGSEYVEQKNIEIKPKK